MRFLVAATVAAAGLVLAGGASAGSSYNLHPSGFGTHSYAAWKAQQGTPDDTGNANQALYFQKMTEPSVTTFAAGVAVITGVEGTPLSDLTGLSWWHREDGHCGAGAPRWNVVVQDTSGGRHTVFLGCIAAQHDETGVTTNGFGWCKDTQPSPATTIAGSAGKPVGDLTIESLAIVFDEGTDTLNPPPAGCAQQGEAPGFVYLDNIAVKVGSTVHCWTNASDNGNTSSTATCGPPAGTSTTGSTLNLGVPTGVAVDPTDTALVNGLNLAAPNVPLLSWSLYPNVIY
jgi:hypothetical protein